MSEIAVFGSHEFEEEISVNLAGGETRCFDTRKAGALLFACRPRVNMIVAYVYFDFNLMSFF